LRDIRAKQSNFANFHQCSNYPVQISIFRDKERAGFSPASPNLSDAL